jgi:small subunit ribosomal protein S6
MLLLDPKAEDATRAKIRADVRATIEAEGTILNTEDYGPRALAFEIDHGTEAEYDLIQFEAPTGVLEQLQRTLPITDGVVRFRIIKVRPGTPAAPDLRRGAEPAVESAPEADADAPAEPVAS